MGGNSKGRSKTVKVCPTENIRIKREIRVKENKDKERLPQGDSFTPFYL